ncbi:MAG: YeeE/YedE thiosulfate transporter family protein [Ignavibacteria bacterium]|jgi:uncharacterized membrane protein YedE/YeeE
MNAPFYKLGYFNYDFSLAVAFVIGIGFGFFLERGGLGSSTKLAAQFYFKDMTVFKVMFTAIITALLGLFWLSWISFVDLNLIYVNPTYILPQLIGGLIFGIGFVTGGLCPGTCLVSSATGRIDGLVTLVGIFCGIFLFGETVTFFYDFLYSTSAGQITLPQLLNIPHSVILFIVVVLAIAGFAGAEVLEKKFSAKVN